MEIKFVPNKDLMQLFPLLIEMHKCMDSSTNEFGAINTFMHEANTQEDFTVVGLYDGDKLMGFVKGYCFSKKTFYFSGIYVIIKNNKHTKQLIDYCFDLIKQKGYSAWTLDATNGNISSIIEKYGAKVKYTRYIKELD